jgi:amino acid adenylation domain-containing protein
MKLIHELFEDQVNKTPDKTALIYGTHKISYIELNERANEIANDLHDNGVVPESVVGIRVGRSPEMIISILAVLKSGGAYLPIDKRYPIKRMEYMLQNSQTKILLTDESFGNRISFDGECLHVKEINRNGSKENQPSYITSENLAYIIYTSGSTGKPKGVMMEHRSIINFINGITERIRFEEHDSILCWTNISFDIFFLETLLPLVNGMTVVIANEQQQNNPRAVRDLMHKFSINLLQTTPSRLQMIVDDRRSSDALAIVTKLLIGGERLSNKLLSRIKKMTTANIYNLYGPTETTIWSTVKDVTHSLDVSIGVPLKNTRIYIMDENQEPVPNYTMGEICIAGTGLARGYVNAVSLTQKQFVISSEPISERLYRTGDLGRYREDGDIEILGRMDEQVKIRGNRVELSEIESVLLNHPRVEQAVVIYVKKETTYSLVAFYTGHKVSVIELKEAVSDSLPEYMVPEEWVLIDNVPMNMNGKLDKFALLGYLGLSSEPLNMEENINDI